MPTENTIADPVARKLAEWVILRSDNTKPSFQRYAAFVTANPSWPHAPLFRRRAENALWNDKLDDATVLAFFADQKPTTAKGRFMLARALLAKGDRAGAEALVREAWRNEDCSRRRREQGARDVRRHAHARGSQSPHGAPLLRRRHRGGLARGAARSAAIDIAVARAWAAVINKAGNAKALLDAVPAARAARGRLHFRAGRAGCSKATSRRKPPS